MAGTAPHPGSRTRGGDQAGAVRQVMLVQSLCWRCLLWPGFLMALAMIIPTIAADDEFQAFGVIALTIVLTFITAKLVLYVFRCERCDKQIFGGNSSAWPSI